jgi:hypothetical protein
MRFRIEGGYGKTLTCEEGSPEYIQRLEYNKKHGKVMSYIISVLFIILVLASIVL